MALIPQNLIDDILNRSDIVEIISGYIPLKRAGRNLKALCPFHQEKTPSFIVSPDKQIYHCFGCQEGGNVISFLMRYERIEFHEAVEILSKKTGVYLPKTEEPANRDSNLLLYRINELACSFYLNQLSSDQGMPARKYILKRNIKPETEKLFKIGFASDRWSALTDFLRQKNVPLTMQEKAGLIVRKEAGGYYDRFRNRIVFPIFDTKSRVVGFGARILPSAHDAKDKDLAKYINSPESPIYVKGRLLYNLNLAKQAIMEKDAAIVVEGYLDCITPYQQGCHNIIASLGTAFTSEQARVIKRYTHNVIMVYDADDAGQIATLRSLDIFLEEDMQVRVAVLPEGFDPDSYVLKHGIESFNELMSQGMRLFDYKLELLKSIYNDRETEGKLKISQEMLATINKFKNPILKADYVRRLSEEIDIKEDALILASKDIKDYAHPFNASRIQKKEINTSPTERLLIKLMLEEEELVRDLMGNISPADFKDERISKIVSIMFDLVSQGKKVVTQSLVSCLPGADLSQIICELTFMPEITSEDKNRVICDCVKRIKEQRIKMRKDHLHKEIRLAQDLKDEVRLKELMEEFCRLSKPALKKEEVPSSNEETIIP